MSPSDNGQESRQHLLPDNLVSSRPRKSIQIYYQRFLTPAGSSLRMIEKSYLLLLIGLSICFATVYEIESEMSILFSKKM